MSEDTVALTISREEAELWATVAGKGSGERIEKMAHRFAPDYSQKMLALEARVLEVEGERDAAVAGLEDLRALVRLKAASEIVAALNGEET